jgi:hypothetical protein
MKLYIGYCGEILGLPDQTQTVLPEWILNATDRNWKFRGTIGRNQQRKWTMVIACPPSFSAAGAEEET